jgi:hypothetical protein
MRGADMIRWIGFAVGFLTFLAAHAIEVMQWARWFGGAHEPWFLNSGPAVLFTLGCVCAASGIVALLNASPRKVRGITIAGGSFVAMTTMLFLMKEGPGTIFPIVMVAGGVLILTSSTLGAWVGREVRAAVKGR